MAVVSPRSHGQVVSHGRPPVQDAHTGLRPGLLADGRHHRDVQDVHAAADSTARPVATGAPGEVAAPMPGAIVTVNFKVGDEVQKGDVLLSLEAMKMETSVYADQDGKVEEVFIKAGDQVDAKDLLLKFEA